MTKKLPKLETSGRYVAEISWEDIVDLNLSARVWDMLNIIKEVKIEYVHVQGDPLVEYMYCSWKISYADWHGLSVKGRFANRTTCLDAVRFLFEDLAEAVYAGEKNRFTNPKMYTSAGDDIEDEIVWPALDPDVDDWEVLNSDNLTIPKFDTPDPAPDLWDPLNEWHVKLRMDKGWGPPRNIKPKGPK